MYDVVDSVSLTDRELRVPSDVDLRNGSAKPARASVAVTYVPTYEFPDGSVVSFRKARHVGGCAYRVAINGMGIDYLEDGAKPSADYARFFFEKHIVRGGV